MRGISWDTTAEDLLAFFRPFGLITNTHVGVSKHTNFPFGFVDFLRACDAQKAVAKLDGTLLKGAKIIVEPKRAQ